MSKRENFGLEDKVFYGRKLLHGGLHRSYPELLESEIYQAIVQFNSKFLQYLPSDLGQKSGHLEVRITVTEHAEPYPEGILNLEYGSGPLPKEVDQKPGTVESADA